MRPPVGMEAASGDGMYRYLLSRRFDWKLGLEKRCCLFVMLNPSSADARMDDPTLRRCIGYALREGASELEVVNLYGFRTPYPAVLRRALDPVGPDNDRHILEALSRAQLVIAAWGRGMGSTKDPRIEVFAQLVDRVGCPVYSLGVNGDGSPPHPLYLKRDAELVRWMSP